MTTIPQHAVEQIRAFADQAEAVASAIDRLYELGAELDKLVPNPTPWPNNGRTYATQLRLAAAFLRIVS